MYAYKGLRLPHESEPYIYIRASIPLASATRAANAAMLRNFSTFVLLFLIGLLLAWFIGKHLIVRPAMMLKEAAGQLAAGADTVNVSSVVKGGELGDVARAFDGMAEALIQEKTALRESEQRWATTLSSIGDAVIATDVAGRIVFMNAVAERMTGWTLREVSQKPVTDAFRIVNEHSRKKSRALSPKCSARVWSSVWRIIHYLLTKDGVEVPIDDSGAPIRDQDGKTMGVVLVFRDISERKYMEKDRERLLAEVQRQAAQLTATLDSMADGLVIDDADGQKLFRNAAADHILQATDEERAAHTLAERNCAPRSPCRTAPR